MAPSISSRPGAPGELNVGVDPWDFAPRPLDQAGVRALRPPPSPLRAGVDRGLTQPLPSPAGHFPVHPANL